MVQQLLQQYTETKNQVIRPQCAQETVLHHSTERDTWTLPSGLFGKHSLPDPGPETDHGIARSPKADSQLGIV